MSSVSKEHHDKSPAAERFLASDFQVLGLAVVFALALSARAAADSPYRMEGIVTDAETKKPVAGVKVEVFQLGPNDKGRSAVSDNNGRYVIPLPIGSGFAVGFVPPQGYFDEFAGEWFATTAEAPVFTKNYEIRKGVSLKFAFEYPQNLRGDPRVHVTMRQRRGDDTYSTSCELDKNGEGTIALPALDGDWGFGCVDWKGIVDIPNSLNMAAIFQKGFNPRKIVGGIRRDQGTLIVRDTKNRTARLVGCGARIRDKELVIVMGARPIPDPGTMRLTGKVVDPDGIAVAGAAVRAVFAGIPPFSDATTDPQGRFAIQIAKVEPYEKVTLAAMRDGYGSVDTQHTGIVASEAGEADVGTIRLQPELKTKIRVIGPDEVPLHGADVNFSGRFMAMPGGARTDTGGECTIHGLAAGFGVSARFGNLVGGGSYFDHDENKPIVIRLVPEGSIFRERLPLLNLGAPAPEWMVSKWADGMDRKISDFRGKVLVIVFFQRIWKPDGIPSYLNDLQARFANENDVVFVGIHNAGIDPKETFQTAKELNWGDYAAIDAGGTSKAGVTAARYGVSGFPFVIVVDQEGKIDSNGGRLVTVESIQRLLQTY